MNIHEQSVSHICIGKNIDDMYFNGKMNAYINIKIKFYFEDSFRDSRFLAYQIFVPFFLKPQSGSSTPSQTISGLTLRQSEGRNPTIAFRGFFFSRQR